MVRASKPRSCERDTRERIVRVADARDPVADMLFFAQSCVDQASIQRVSSIINLVKRCNWYPNMQNGRFKSYHSGFEVHPPSLDLVLESSESKDTRLL